MQSLNEERRAILDARRIADRIAKIPGHIAFASCGGIDYEERKSQQVFYVIPNTQRTLSLHPRNFWKSSNLKMIFDVHYNSVNICWSRKNYDSYLNDIEVSAVHIYKVTFTSAGMLEADFDSALTARSPPPGFLAPTSSSRSIRGTL